jgi:hypothetical protein
MVATSEGTLDIENRRLWWPRVDAPARFACLRSRSSLVTLVYAIAREPNNGLVRERQAGSRLLPNFDRGLPLDRQAVASTHLRRRSSLPPALLKLVGDIPPPAPRYVAMWRNMRRRGCF